MTIKSLFDLTKFRLTLSVVFSSFISYMLGFKEFDIKVLMLLIFGGIFIVAASNIYNQIIEKDLDAVLGSRFIKGGKIVDYPFIKLVFNRIGNLMAKLLIWTDLNDFTN